MQQGTRNCGFEVRILKKTNQEQTNDRINASYVPLRKIVTSFGDYVIAASDQEFIIELNSNDQMVYGVKLYIDEQEIKYKKTFKSRGFFMGFKLGEGRFQSFKFATPLYESKESSVAQPMRSEIKIVFYKTHESLVSSQTVLKKSIRKAFDAYVPGLLKDNKKFFRKSLTVTAGDDFHQPEYKKNKLLEKLQDLRTERFKEHSIDFDSVLDTVVIYYGDFNSLLVQGVLSLGNYDHLNVVPLLEIAKRPKIVERILMTILKKHNPRGLQIQQIEEEFKKFIDQNFEALGVGPLITFISLRNGLFKLDNNYCLTCSEKAKNIYLDLRDVDPTSEIVPDKYFRTGREANLKNKFCCFETKESKKRSSSKNGPNVVIDLTHD